MTFLICPPSSFGAALTATLREIATARGQIMQMWDKGARSLEGLSAPVVFICDDPQDLPRQSTGPLLIVLPTADLFCSWAMERFDISAAEALRFASRWRSAASEFAMVAPTARTMIVRPDHRDLHIVSRCAQLLNLDSDEVWLGIYDTHFLNSRGSDTWEINDSILALEGSHLHAIDAYDAGLLGKPIQLIWPRSMFNSGDAPQEVCPALIDLTGRTRILLFGPYFGVPAGCWRASAFFSADADAEGAAIRLEMNFGGAITASDIESVSAGTFAATFVFKLDSTAVADFRVWLLRPRLAGTIQFAGLLLERLGADEDSLEMAGPVPDVFFDSAVVEDRRARKARR